ncbi:MAG: hypothetical protein U0796_08210 [Gemmatales bacterium]
MKLDWFCRSEKDPATIVSRMIDQTLNHSVLIAQRRGDSGCSWPRNNRLYRLAPQSSQRLHRIGSPVGDDLLLALEIPSIKAESLRDIMRGHQLAGSELSECKILRRQCGPWFPVLPEIAQRLEPFFRAPACISVGPDNRRIDQQPFQIGLLTGGEVHDVTQASALIDGISAQSPTSHRRSSYQSEQANHATEHRCGRPQHSINKESIVLDRVLNRLL